MNCLRQNRFFKGISQHKLALIAKVHQSRISLIENDLIQPRPDEKDRIAKGLGVPLEDIWPKEEGN